MEPFPDKDELRRRVPLAAVCARLGVAVGEDGRAVCPFHDDTRPSFSLWVDPFGVERWGCFPCGLSGDCFDLVQRLERVDFAQAIRWVYGLSSKVPPRRPPAPRPAFDRAACEAYVLDAQLRAHHHDPDGLLPVAAGLREEPDREAAEALRAELKWGIDERGNVIMPHYDWWGVLTGAKVRAPDGQKWAFTGSRYPALYGAWRGLGRRGDVNVVLCEGETDLAYAVLNSSHDALALPSGAGYIRDEWPERIARHWRIVYLALDADDAGRKAADKWATALRDKVDVYECRLPEGLDLRKARPNMRDLLAAAVQRA